MSVFVGDIGVQLKLNAGIDISNYTTLQIRYRKPTGVVGSWTATVSGTNYAIYDTLAGDLDVSGVWIVQIYIITSAYTAYGKKAQLFVDVPITV
jgi:hypothetical protein